MLFQTFLPLLNQSYTYWEAALSLPREFAREDPWTLTGQTPTPYGTPTQTYPAVQHTCSTPGDCLRIAEELDTSLSLLMLCFPWSVPYFVLQMDTVSIFIIQVSTKLLFNPTWPEIFCLKWPIRVTREWEMIMVAMNFIQLNMVFAPVIKELLNRSAVPEDT